MKVGSEERTNEVSGVPIALAVGVPSPVQASTFSTAEATVVPSSLEGRRRKTGRKKGGGNGSKSGDHQEDIQITARCHSMLGEACRLAPMRHYKRAIELCQEVLQLCSSIPLKSEKKIVEATALSTLGLIYQEKWADREAVQFHEEVLEICSASRETAFVNLEAATMCHLAKLYRACGQDHMVYECEVLKTHSFQTIPEKRTAVAKARNNGKKPARRDQKGISSRNSHSVLRAAMICTLS